jgi:hypothetical protein
MKRSQGRFLFPAIGTLLGLNFYNKNNIAKCYLDYDNKDDSSNFAGEGYDIFGGENIPMDHDIEYQKLEQKMSRKERLQPVPFKNLNQKAKSQADDEKWDGLRVVFDWNPSPMWKMEYQAFFNYMMRFRTFKLSTMHFIQDQANKHKGIALIGRVEGAQGQGLQAHININKMNKLSVIAQYPKNDIKQGFYCLEYNLELDRFVLNARLTNNDDGYSVVTNVLPYTFVGFEATRKVTTHPNNSHKVSNFYTVIVSLPHQ